MSDQRKIGDELKRIESEPLLPVEKRLIIWSLVIGIVLLAVLVWLSRRFFPAGPAGG